MNKLFNIIVVVISSILMLSCNGQSKNETNGSSTVFTGAPGEIKLVVLDPGHFHASLLQKFSNPQVNDTVFVYAPEGVELDQYLASIEAYNNRMENPTDWVEIVYTGEDYLEKMLSDKNGNVVILAVTTKEDRIYI